MVIQSKKVWLADQFVPAAIEVNDGRITAILPYGTKDVDDDYGDKRIVPGFIFFNFKGSYEFYTNDANEDGLRYFQDKYPGTMAARIEFDPALSQRMYAAADMFLMPSKFEPCGLSQIIAMRYGTLPIVRETGGLKDTVIPYNEFTGEGTGFSFTNFNGDEMGDAVFRAARLFWDNREAWNQLVTQAMSQDFSWTRSADKYLDLYFFMHPEIERPAAVVDEPEAAPDPVAAEEPKAEEKPVEAETVKTDPKVKVEATPEPEPEVKPAAKPAAKKTTTRKTTAKKATASKTTAAKTTTTRKRTTAGATKAAEAEAVS